MNVIPGPFNSFTIKINSDIVPIGEVEATLDLLLQNASGAVYLAIPEEILCKYYNIVGNYHMKFHHYQNNIYTYYIWNVEGPSGPIEDKVPAYCSSIEGVGAIILSPDEKKILLVWEYGKWKIVTGSLKPGESLIETVFREVSEEVSVKLDPNYIISIGEWHISKARFNLINDTFHAFVVKAENMNFQVDNVEIHKAQWFNIKDLLEIQIPEFYNNIPDLTSISVEAYDTKFSWIMLVWLHKFIYELLTKLKTFTIKDKTYTLFI